MPCGSGAPSIALAEARCGAVRPRIKALDLGGFDSNILLISRGGTPESTGNLPEL